MKTLDEHNKDSFSQRPKTGVVCSEEGCKEEMRFLREDGKSMLRVVICPVHKDAQNMYFPPPPVPAPEVKKQ